MSDVKTKAWDLATQCIQAGYTPGNGEPRVLPIYQSTTFKYESAEQMGRLFDLAESGYFYTRLSNPTNDAVATKIAALESGVAAILTSSGQAATFFSLFNLCRAGDHIVSASTIYGGSFNLIAKTLSQMGVEATFVAPDATDEELDAAFRPNTKVVFGETLANPALVVLDIERFAAAAHRHGVPLIVDNTFPTPIHCRPIEWGADIVIHSTTKYMDGHATSVGGVIVDGGTFDWNANAARFPQLTQPDDTYHGTVFTEAFGPAAYYARILAVLMRDLGAIPSPHNSFLLNLGLETLHLRMPQHAANARAIASFLKDHPRVTWVKFPELADDSQHALQQKYMPDGTCGVISFGVAGGREAAAQVLDRLKLVAIVTHVADIRSCALHPASTTHRQMTDAQLRAAGVAPELVRLSVGLESSADLIADLEQALADSM